MGRGGRKKEKNKEEKASSAFLLLPSPLPLGGPDAQVSLCPVVTGLSPQALKNKSIHTKGAMLH